MKPATRRQRRNIDQISSAFLEFIREQPCCVCVRYETRQTQPTEASHCGDRGLGQKASDFTALPMCARHHRIGPSAIHVLGRRFWSTHSLDRDKLIAHYNQLFESRIEVFA